MTATMMSVYIGTIQRCKNRLFCRHGLPLKQLQTLRRAWVFTLLYELMRLSLLRHRLAQRLSTLMPMFLSFRGETMGSSAPIGQASMIKLDVRAMWSHLQQLITNLCMECLDKTPQPAAPAVFISLIGVCLQRYQAISTTCSIFGEMT